MRGKWTPAPWIIEEADQEADGSVYPARIVGGSRRLVLAYLTDRSSDAMAESQTDVRSKRGAHNLLAASPVLADSAAEIDRLMLVIESAVRNADPANHADVLAALKANRAALSLAHTEPSQGEK